ncbi:hypothetical protein EDB83DRAFT_2323523 [Lactarius deliciosus]|nr:hypothetical protein EDB83DRAFT_2323523 [Lactarius deliciosus]
MGKNGQELWALDITTGNPALPAMGVTYHAKHPSDVKHWITSKQSTWCTPGTLMGPDLLTWLLLDDGKLLLLLIQAKCYLEGNTNTLASQVTAKAIHSLNTKTFYTSLKHKSAEVKSMLDAINMPDECFTGAWYNILSKGIESAIDADPHPLATLNHAPLLSSLATYDGTLLEESSG